MSEPLSSSEIEDVVSSVRRLVSPDARPRPISRDLGSDRLLLTPALRIVAEQTGSGPAIVKLEAVAKKARPDPKLNKTRIIASPILTADGAEILPPAADPAPSDGGEIPVASLSEMALGAEDAELVGAPVSVEPVVETTKDPALDPAAVSQSETGPPRLRRTRTKGAEAQLDDRADGGPKAAAKGTAGKRPAARTAKPGKTGRAAAFGARGSEKDVDHAPATGLTDADGNPISLLDEEQLTILLRRLIREELQGGLGEKITRTVRKLVRAEINLALAAQTLD